MVNQPAEAVVRQTSSAQSVILVDSFGCRSVVPATVPEALAIYDEYRSYVLREFSPRFPSVAKEPGAPLLCPPRAMVRALCDILMLATGSTSLSVRWLIHGAAPRRVDSAFDNRPPVFIQEAWKTELLLYLAPYIFERHRAFDGWETLLQSRIQAGWHPEKELSFLTGTRWDTLAQKGVLWLPEDTIDNIRMAYGIEQAIGDPSRPVAVKDILMLCNYFAHRDVRYELVQQETAFS